jgi:hypothetical protein
VHAGFVEKVAQQGRRICTAASAFHSPTLQRGVLKSVALVGVYAKSRDGYGALRHRMSSSMLSTGALLIHPSLQYAYGIEK